MIRYADSTLKRMTKEDLIEIIRCLEQNIEGLENMNENQFNLLIEKDMYKWHDLRKNENDFPTEEEIKQFHFVLAYSDSQKKYSICESKVLKLYVCDYGNYDETTRWKFIDSFEEDKE